MDVNKNIECENKNGVYENKGKTTERKVKPILKWLTTILLYSSYIALGMTDGLLPSTFLDFKERLEVDISTMSFAYTTRYAGLALGGILAGYLTNIKRLNRTLLVGVGMILSALFVIATPWLQHVAIVMLLIGLSGMSIGTASTVHNVLLISTWGHRSGPYLQGLHLSFSAGTFITPVLALPFLSKHIHTANYTNDQADVTLAKTYVSLNNSALTMNESYHFGNMSNRTTTTMTMTDSTIQFAYLIIGIYVGIMGLCFCVMARFNKQISYKPAKEEKDADENDSSQLQDKLPKYYKMKFLILLGLIFFSYGSIQYTIGGLLIPFLVKALDWEKQQATFLITFIWITAAVARFLSIPIYATRVVSYTQFLVINITLVFISSIIFVIFVKYHYLVIWITMLLISLGQASVFVAAMLWYQENVMPVKTGIIPSVLSTTLCLGAISAPLLTGYLIEKVDAMCFPYTVVIFTILMTFLSCFTYISVRLYKKRHKQDKNATEVEMKPMM